MRTSLILASASEIRAQLLRNAGLVVTVQPARIDEDAIRASLAAESVPPRNLADTLAEMKALKISATNPAPLVLGCDQVLALDNRLFSKPENPDDARTQLAALSGNTHRLFSAAVVVQGGKALWRHVGVVRLTMHSLSKALIDDYVDANWDSIRHAVGCYKLEEEGVQLFADIEGDYFDVLGLPLIPLLSWLRLRGDLPQ